MRRRRTLPLLAGVLVIFLAVILSVAAALYFMLCPCSEPLGRPFTTVRTIAGINGELGEPFGVAVKDGEIYISDGQAGKIWKFAKGSAPAEFARGLHTPSAIAFNGEGDLVVADTGSHTIRKIDRSGAVTLLAGIEGRSGDADGPAMSAMFNGPIGIAMRDDGSIAVADTYNDRIRIIKDGTVTTLAGSTRGFSEGTGTAARFDTPSSVAAWTDGRVLVADTLNARIRVIEPDGRVWTLTGRGGEEERRDGLLIEASFIRPSVIANGKNGDLFIADGNVVRVIRNRPIHVVETLSKPRRGFTDGPPAASTFNRISGLAMDDDGELVIADSDNGAVRVLSTADLLKADREIVDRRKRTDPAEFRGRQPARWPYIPPEARRDIAGTLGEIRGHILDDASNVWFHNGLDIAGGYGEKATFIRDEKVLNPISAENFDTSRELIRLPAIGYIHIRLGRDAGDRPLGDDRFQFDPGMRGVRVRRGSVFNAGDIIGTLNSLNHVHLIAGPSGDEMNALDALSLPGVGDSIAPVIEETTFFDENWQQLETEKPAERITLTRNTRIVVDAYDRMDGNPERRRLGVYRLGYQVLNRDGTAATDVNWNINFDRNPAPEAVRIAYAPGSRSGATGETSLRYIVTNKVNGDSFSEGFLDLDQSQPGQYILRVFAADYFGNSSSKDINIEVAK